MKKIIIYLLTIIPFIIVSCDNSIEGKIKEEFKEYARCNFNNPESIKEIVSVESFDTISNDKYIGLFLDCIEKGKKVENISDSIIQYMSDEKIAAKINKAREQDQYNSYIKDFSENANTLMSYLNKDEIYRSTYMIKITEFIADTSSLPKMNMIVYKIKYRMKDNNSLVLKEAFVVIDKIENDKITIRNEEMKKKELPQKILETMDAAEKYIKLSKEKQVIYTQTFDSYNRLKILLK